MCDDQVPGCVRGLTQGGPGSGTGGWIGVSTMGDMNGFGSGD